MLKVSVIQNFLEAPYKHFNFNCPDYFRVNSMYKDFNLAHTCYSCYLLPSKECRNDKVEMVVNIKNIFWITDRVNLFHHGSFGIFMRDKFMLLLNQEE